MGTEHRGTVPRSDQAPHREIRVVGDKPYLLVELRPESDGVHVDLFSAGLVPNPTTKAMWLAALNELYTAIEDSTDFGPLPEQ